MFFHIPHSTFHTRHSSKGFTLLETLVYVAVLATITALVTTTLISMLRPAVRVRAAQALTAGANDTLERMSREIRNSYDIDTLQSSFGTNPGTLALRMMDGAVQETHTFYLSGSRLMLNDNGTVGALSADSVAVTSLVFYELSTPVSKGVRIELELSTTTSAGTRSETFYTTLMLRDSYN
jgi:type II secretory pathway pseudopilin PulG